MDVEITLGMEQALAVLGGGEARRSNVSFAGSERTVSSKSADALIDRGLVRYVEGKPDVVELTELGAEALGKLTGALTARLADVQRGGQVSSRGS